MKHYGIRNTEYPVVILLLLIAAALRFYALPDLPLGLDQDEIINAIAIRGIMAGERPVFITAGWGREPVYAYAAATMVSLAGDMVLGMRLTTVMLSMLFLVISYITASRLLGRTIGLMTLGWLTVSFWPLMTSRAGERNIMLALFTTLAVYLFHRALKSRRISGIRYWEYVIAGMALGATWWTYQSGRVMPLVFLLFVVYLAIRQRPQLQEKWKGILLFLVVGTLIASPLLIYLATHPGAETGDFKTQSLQALRQGNWKPMVSAALGALGLFTVRGEDYWLHNIPGRPIFDWLSGLLFYAGLGVAIWRGLSGQQEHILLLLWLSVGLMPAMITDPPSHHRMANVMAAAYMLPALGAEQIGRALHARRCTLYALATALLLVWIGTTTRYDFFNVWAVASEVQDLHFARLAQLSRDLDRDPDTSPVVVAGTYIEDIEPLVPVALMKRHDISFRWHDTMSTLVIPGSVSRARYFDPDSGLRVEDTEATRRNILARASAAPNVWLAPPGDALPASVGAPATRPISFDNRVELVGIEIKPPGAVAHLRVLRDGTPSSTAMFVHLTTPDLKIIAQDDRLGFPTHSWRAGDVFTQAFTLNTLAPFASPAWLEIGIYDRATRQRWGVAGMPGVNRVLMQWPGQ